MAAGGLAGALALVPWGTLIDKAPQIAASAAELVAKARPAPPPAPAAPTPPDPMVELAARVVALEGRVDEASRLISGLANSNATLIASADRGRRMLHASLGLSLLSLAVAAGAWFA